MRGQIERSGHRWVKDYLMLHYLDSRLTVLTTLLTRRRMTLVFAATTLLLCNTFLIALQECDVFTSLIKCQILDPAETAKTPQSRTSLHL